MVIPNVIVSPYRTGAGRRQRAAASAVLTLRTRAAAVGLLCSLFLLAMTSPGQAQTQPQPQQPQAQGTAPGGLAPQPRQRLEPTGQSFGDWRLICSVPNDPTAAPQPPQACFISQRVVDPNSQQPVLVVTIGYFTARRLPGALLSMPLGIPLSTGVQISVDGRPLSTVPFEVCRRDGCQTFVQLNETLINSFKAGNQGAATVRTGERSAFNVPFSLQGFTAGFAQVK